MNFDLKILGLLGIALAYFLCYYGRLAKVGGERLQRKNIYQTSILLVFTLLIIISTRSAMINIEAAWTYITLVNACISIVLLYTNVQWLERNLVGSELVIEKNRFSFGRNVLFVAIPVIFLAAWNDKELTHMIGLSVAPGSCIGQILFYLYVAWRESQLGSPIFDKVKN